jgi:hypothetical protein
MSDFREKFLTAFITAAGTAIVTMLFNLPDLVKKFFGREDTLHLIMEKQKGFQDVTNKNAQHFSEEIDKVRNQVARLEGLYDGLC